VIRVLIADDNAVVRRGVAGLLEAADGIEVAGEASNGKDAVTLAREVPADVVLLDVRMPIMDGVEAAGHIAKTTKVMMLTYAEEEELVAGAIKAGASGYLVHGRFEPDELERAVRDLAAGRSVLSPSVVTAVFDAVRRGPDRLERDGPAALTEREQEIMNLLAKGLNNRAIASELFVSEKTVKNHINRIYAKLGVSTRPEAIAVWLGVSGSDRTQGAT
jgi:DNA-binding NarL/FixJ family response regulator